MPTMYDNMTFPDYQHREYPKFIQTGTKKDANTGHVVPTGVTVNSLAEEEAITRPPQPADPAPAPVAVQAEKPTTQPDPEPAPRPRGRPPGSGKTDPLAKVDPDQDPDA